MAQKTALHPTGTTGVPYSFAPKTAASGQDVSVPVVTFTLDAGLPIGTGVAVPVVTFDMQTVEVGTGLGVPVVTFTLSPEDVDADQTTQAVVYQMLTTYNAVGAREHIRRSPNTRNPDTGDKE